jgi:hypothetical protein
MEPLGEDNVDRLDLRTYLEQHGVTIGPKAWPGNPPHQPGRFRAVFDPFKAAPVYEPSGGGVLYFDVVDRTTFDQYLKSFAVTRGFADGYAVFVSTLLGSRRQRDRRYLAQLRIVSIEALEQQFGLRDLRDEKGRPLPPTKQPLGVGELMWQFILHQQGHWGTGFSDGRAPAGALGGDGEYAREQLAFALMSEAPGVIRIWSRAWLVER